METDKSCTEEKRSHLEEVTEIPEKADAFAGQEFEVQLLTNELTDLKRLFEGRESDLQVKCVHSKIEIDNHRTDIKKERMK